MNPEQFKQEEREALKALERTVESIVASTPEGTERDDARRELMMHLAGTSPEEFDQIIERSLTIDELMRDWIKDPDLIKKYRNRFNEFPLEHLKEMLRNIRGSNETIIEEAPRTGTNDY